jgi:hypothetical protein
MSAKTLNIRGLFAPQDKFYSAASTFGFHKMLRNVSVVERLLAFEEELSFMDLTSYLVGWLVGWLFS